VAVFLSSSVAVYIIRNLEEERYARLNKLLSQFDELIEQ
jgi:hypothetical protein